MINNVFLVGNHTYSVNYDFVSGKYISNMYKNILVFPEIVKTVNGRDIVREKNTKNHYYVFDWIKPSKAGRGFMAKSRNFRTIKAATEYIEKNDQLIREMGCD